MAEDRLPREVIAMRVAQELPDGGYVNLGIGIPTLVSQFIPDDRTIVYHSENGVLNYGPMATEEEQDVDLINAGGQFLASVQGMAFFHSAEAFAMIRGGHIDVTVLGALQVSETGDLANWMIPGKLVKGMGGAMDLVAGVGRVVVVMDHTNKHGDSKILKECTLPLTGKAVVNRIITNLGVLDVVDGGLKIVETADGVTKEELIKSTKARIVS